jgi:hypothetical protein
VLGARLINSQYTYDSTLDEGLEVIVQLSAEMPQEERDSDISCQHLLSMVTMTRGPVVQQAPGFINGPLQADWHVLQ